MNLFVNAVSKNAFIALFDEERNILKEKSFEIQLNESSGFIIILDEFLKENGLSYGNLENIIAVNGPGSFTGIRTIILVINTIAFILKNGELKTKNGDGVYLTPISFFDLYKNYPIIKSSSKRDFFFKKDKNSTIEIIYNDKLEELLKNENISTIYGEGNIKNIKIVEKINYQNIIKNVQLKRYFKIEALYIKKPNIC